MKALDNELTADETCEFERFLEAFTACKYEWQQFEKLKTVSEDMRFKSPSAKVWDEYWLNVYKRL
jgi:anti-sigma factor RsiW